MPLEKRELTKGFVAEKKKQFKTKNNSTPIIFIQNVLFRTILVSLIMAFILFNRDSLMHQKIRTIELFGVPHHKS